MPIVAVLNPKGGCGKTTVSTNLAVGCQRRGLSTLLVDSDPQGSARDWHMSKDDNPVDLMPLDTVSTLKNVHKYSKDYDVVIIDGAAKLADMLAPSIKSADFVLIPVQPSPYDIWACSDLVDLIKARQEVTDGIPKAAFIITRRIPNTLLAGDIDQVLKEFEIPVLKTTIAQRQAYPQTAAKGETVFDSNNSDAANEIQDLISELL